MFTESLHFLLQVDLGIISEIDTSEALAGYSSLRQNLLVITGMTLLLTITALLVTLMLSERATRAMRSAREELEARVKSRTAELPNSLKEISFQQFALNQHAIVSMTDLDGKIIYTNQRLIEVSGYSKEKLLDSTHQLLDSGLNEP